MFRRRRRFQDIKGREDGRREENYKRRQADGAELYKRVYELKNADQAILPETAMVLFREAQHQLALIRQSIVDKTHYDFTVGEELPEGDLATAIAEDITGVMRENAVDPQTILEALSDQLPDVHFTVDWYDAAAMVAAEIRVQRLEGILEGLKLAGLMSR